MKSNRAMGLSLLGGAASAGVLAWLGGRWWTARAEAETEPAPPVALPPEPSGGSGIPLTANEIEALAHVIASEAGSGTPGEQKAVGWTVRNRFRGKSIYAVQFPWRSQKGVNPPFASGKDPTDAHRKLAREILAADQSEDPTGGATGFFEPKLQDIAAKAAAMVRAGQTGKHIINGQLISDIARFKNYKPEKDAAYIRKSWGKGSTVYAIAGRFEFWGSAPLFAKRGGQIQTIVGFDGGAEAPRAAISDLEALSRMVETVCGKRTIAEKQAVAWATRNRARALGVSVARILCPRGEPGPRGTGGRDFASTRLPAGKESRLVAAWVLRAEDRDDPTGGATDFWFPVEQDLLAAVAQIRGAGGIPNRAAMRRALEERGQVPVGGVGDVELLKGEA